MSTKAQIEESTRGTRHAAGPGGLSRWLLPSISDLIFLCVLFSLSIGEFSTRLLGDSDVGWHIRNGELMLRAHAFTRTDPFSFSMAGKPWYAWEWLYDLLVGAIHLRTGLNGVVLLTAIVVAFTFALVFKKTLERSGTLIVTIPVLILAFAASAIHLLARPHVFTWLFAVVFFLVLDSTERAGNWRPLIWLPILMLFWANLHGGFVLGFVLLGIFLLSAAIQYAMHPAERNQTAGWLQTLGLTTVISAIVGLINPYGDRLYIHIYQYLTDRWLMDHIDEFLSPNLHEISGVCFVVLILLAILGLAFSRMRLRPSSLLVLLFSVYSGFYASRNLPIASLLLMLIVTPLLSTVVISDSAAQTLRKILHRCAAFSRKMDLLEADVRGHIWPAAGLVFAILVCLAGGSIASSKLMNARFNPTRFPVQAAGFIAQHNIPGPVFSPDSWGGYLIYRLYPHTRVYLDDRHDLYGDAFFKTYLKIIRVSPEWQQDLDATRAQWVLVPEGSSLANVLKETKEWQPLYEDSVAVLFQRTGSASH